MNTPRPLLALTLVIGHWSSAIAQGPLTPPGAPAPTMKTLDQLDAKLEARTAITGAVTITTPGSYYLKNDITVSSLHGIAIVADNVTLDLNGFTISSTASPAFGAGVIVTSTQRNITIRNGTIKGTTTFAAGAFTTGGFFQGVSTSGSTNVRVVDVTVRGVGGAGITMSAGLSTSAERCFVEVCGGAGITAERVAHCTVDTAGGDGILCSLASNSIGESVSAAALDHGIEAVGAAENCRGTATAGPGLFAPVASNCLGTSDSGIGLSANMATNCQGTSTSGIGLSAAMATNCQGTSTSGSAGLRAFGTAHCCRGQRDGGTAINATIAIGCNVVGTGTVTVTGSNKFLGTP